MRNEAKQEQEEVYSQEVEVSKDRNLERLFRLYVGENAEKFMPLFRYHTNLLDKKFPLSFNLMACLLTIVWLFYRKLYLTGIALLLIPTVVYTIFPDLPGFPAGGFAGMIAVIANSYYASIAIKEIRKIESMDISNQEKDLLILEKGGTSIGGALVGVAIYGAIIFATYLSLSS